MENEAKLQNQVREIKICRFKSEFNGVFIMKVESDSYICKDYDGNLFISFEQYDEMVLSANPLLTHCLAVVKTGEDYLLGWNKWRNRYSRLYI